MKGEDEEEDGDIDYEAAGNALDDDDEWWPGDSVQVNEPTVNNPLDGGSDKWRGDTLIIETSPGYKTPLLIAYLASQHQEAAEPDRRTLNNAINVSENRAEGFTGQIIT